jgi:hypothetical protein
MVPMKRANACERNRDELIRLAADGLTLSEMARRVGTNKRHVKTWLIANGVAYTPHSPKGAGNGRWKGGRRIDKGGYVLLYRPEHPDADSHGLIREHRLIMERQLGRRLLPTEVVHHRDDNPANNDPSNLELYSTNAEHLAETLKGKCPNFSPEGWERMRERGRWLAASRRAASRPPS